MSFYAGSANIFGKEIVVRQKDPNSDEWGEKPDEYVRLTDALRAWCNGTCVEEVRFCDDGPCPGVRRMLKLERVKLKPTHPGREKGHWMYNDPLRGDFQCDCCGERNMTAYRYCPRCGAYMYDGMELDEERGTE